MAQDDNYQSSDFFNKAHTGDELKDDENLQENQGDPETPDEEADRDIEGTKDETGMHVEAFGDDDEETPIGDEITKDDVAHEEGIDPSEEKKKIKKSGI